MHVIPKDNTHWFFSLSPMQLLFPSNGGAHCAQLIENSPEKLQGSARYTVWAQARTGSACVPICSSSRKTLPSCSLHCRSSSTLL